MKDTLKRMLGMAPEPAKADNQTEEVTMEVTQTQEAVAAAVAEQVDVAALQASLATVTSELAEAHAKIAELTAEVTAAVEFNAARVKEALEAKMTARKEKIVAAVGTEGADAMFKATESMEDTAFETIMSTLTAASTKEAKTSLFTEVGVEAEADAGKLAATNGVMDYLTSKYQKQA